MSAAFDRHLRLNGAHNVRDLGGYLAGASETQWRRVLRADALHRLDEADIAALIAAGLRTVVDLRHAQELTDAPNPFNGHAEVRYFNVPLFDQLSPAAQAKYAPDEDALLALYIEALASRHDAIRQVLTHIAEAEDGAVMFHCTAGKDRTGIIAALLLAAAGVDADTIRDDYALTGPAIAPMIERLVADAEARGADLQAFMPFLACEPKTMQAMLEHIEAEYGGAIAYLRSIGLDEATVRKLRARLVTAETLEEIA